VNSLPGLLIPITGWSSGNVTPILKQWSTTPVEAVEWQAVEQQTDFNTDFDINVWELTDEMKAVIRQSVAEYLASFRNRDTRLTIIGHASPIGSEEYNLWLSKKRAQSVYDYIRSILSDDEYAILPQNTTIEGYGEYYAVNWAFYEADSRAPEWQTVAVYLNGQIITRLSERIVGSD
jgi:outer membrane protein OmpA-like peptidoglycan-associated protein